MMAGRVLTALGALTATIGSVTVPLAYTDADPSQSLRVASVASLVGAVALAVGIPLLFTSRTGLILQGGAPTVRY